MRRLSEQEKDRIRDEREIIVAGLEHRAVKLVFGKLQEASDKMLLKYDECDFVHHPEKAVYIQAFRDIVQKEIPRIFEAIINVDADLEPERLKWSFWGWLKSFAK